MNFSIEVIKEAHRKFTGVDFPKLIKEFKLMGMLINIYNIQTGLVTYEHKNGEQVKVQSNAVDVPINTMSSTDVAQDVLKRHQAGETDFLTFCIVLGIVEGFTEWLPISSTGHMLLIDEVLHLNMSSSFKEMFFIVIQLGAILAVILMFWKKMVPLKCDEKAGCPLTKKFSCCGLKVIFVISRIDICYS